MGINKGILSLLLTQIYPTVNNAISILSKYGGSLWVADPAYTFTRSDGTGAASDGSDAGYGRDLCATYGPELRAGKFNNSDGATFTNNVDGSTTVTTNGSQTYAYAGWYADVVQGTVYEVATNANASSRWIYYLHTPGQTDYVNVGSTATGVVGEARNIVSVPTAQGTRTRLLVVRQVGPEFGAGSFIAQPASVREVVGRPLFQSTTSFKPKLKRVPKKLGPELVSNGDFSAGTAGWTVAGTGAALSVTSGVGTVTNGSAAEASLTLPNTVAGKVYEVVADIVALSGTSTVYFVPPEGSSTGNIPKTGAGQLRGVFVSGGGGCRIAVGVSAAGAFFSIDNISVREVLEWAWAWVFDGVDDWLGITGAPASPATAHTMGAVAYASTVASRCSLLAMRNTGNNTPLDALEINTGQPTWRQRNDATTTAALSGDVFPVSTRLVVSMRSDGANAVLRQNGVQKSTSATTTGAITVNNLSIGIGRGANVVDPLSGGIFAAFYAPAAIPDAELLIIERAMAQLGGITI